MALREKLLDELAEHLAEGEEILDAMVGAYDYTRFGAGPAQRGIFAATNRRLIFFSSSRKEYDLESFPYENISLLKHGIKLTSGTLTFRVPDPTATEGWTQPFTTVNAKWIQPVTDLPSFVALIEGRMSDPSARGGGDSAGLFELSRAEPVVSGEFIMRRTSKRTFLVRVDTGWEIRRRAGSQQSVRYGTLRGTWRQGGYEVAIGGAETWTLNVGNPLFCEIADRSGGRIATCEWGEFLEVGESQMNLSTNIVFSDGPNFELRIDGEKDGQVWWWNASLRFKGTLVADGSAGSFMTVHHPTPAAALLLWWAVRRRQTRPYRLPRTFGSYGGGGY